MKYLKIALFATFLFLSVGFACNNDGGGSGKGVLTYNTDRPNPVGDDCLYQETSFHLTPGGVTVRSCVEVPAEAQAAIDRGISHQIRNSSHYNPGWKSVRTLPEYQIFFVPPQAHNVETEPGSPALMVKYLTMNSSVAEVQSAGTCIGVDGAMFVPGKGPFTDARYASIVLPEQSGEGWKYLNYLEESARNESEHIAEWNNDHSMFASFAIVGDVHPHFPDWTDAAVAPKTATSKKRK